tara:strand:- start:1108 stop:2157 length:1050 start_codon:yes stop_codon:yes gene_type:complete
MAEERDKFESISGYDITDFQSPIYKYEEGDFGKDTDIKEFYSLLEGMNYSKSAPLTNIGELSGDWSDDRERAREALLKDLNKYHSDRGQGTSFRDFENAYDPDRPGMDDPEKHKAYIDKLRSNQIRSPHKGNLKDNLDVKAALAIGAAKRGPEETPYDGPFGKIGEYFSKNADARDKLFDYIGAMGKELVKPIQPGQEAAGALVPTLSRGLDKGEQKYAAEKAAETKMMLDQASAMQKANPLQYFSSKMKEARYIVGKQGLDPDSAEGVAAIGQWLMTQGIASTAADLTASLKSLQDQLIMAIDDNEKKAIQGNITKIQDQLNAIIMESIGGSNVSETIIDYTQTIKNK